MWPVISIHGLYPNASKQRLLATGVIRVMATDTGTNKSIAPKRFGMLQKPNIKLARVADRGRQCATPQKAYAQKD